MYTVLPTKFLESKTLFAEERCLIGYNAYFSPAATFTGMSVKDSPESQKRPTHVYYENQLNSRFLSDLLLTRISLNPVPT